MDLKAIPKVELHRHLECSMRLETFKELAPQVGIEMPKTDKEVRDKFLVLEPMKDLESVLKKFLMTQAVLNSEEILSRITYEIIEDCVNDGIKIVELRYAPTFIQLNHDHLSFEKIHRAIVKGVEMAKHLPIAVGLVIIIQRILDVGVAERVTDFAIAHKGEILALDLADNEVGFNCVPFARCFQRAKEAGLNITVHSGEADVPGAARFVWDSIDHLGAQRIGHGLQIIKEPKVMDYVKRKGVILELCPTSNMLTNAIPNLEAHPFRKLMEFGIGCTINTDDPGIFGIDIINEYRVLEQIHGFTREEFDHCNDVAAAACFIPYKIKQKYWPRPINRSLAPWN